MLTKSGDDPAEPLTLEAAKAHCQVLHDEDNTYLTSLIVAARLHIEDEIQSPVPAREYTWTLDCFPAGAFSLPLHPIVSLYSIDYVDTLGASQALSAADWNVESDTSPIGMTCVRPAYNTSWPQTEPGFHKVTIVFTAGYSTVPAPIVHAMKLLVGSLYRDREDSSAIKMHPAALAAHNLLRNYSRLVPRGS